MDVNMSQETQRFLLQIYLYLCDGRVYLAREVLEKILDVNPKDAA